MALHLIKLCVGADSVDDLRDWQVERFKTTRTLFHATRMVPKRGEELLAGGSIYWVIKGQIRVRQLLTAIEPYTDAEGIPRCRLMLDPPLIAVRPSPRRPFQGWRYLTDVDAPSDLPAGAEHDDDMPETMRVELAELGLL